MIITYIYTILVHAGDQHGIVSKNGLARESLAYQALTRARVWLISPI
jgi:hypothetical protein